MVSCQSGLCSNYDSLSAEQFTVAKKVLAENIWGIDYGVIVDCVA